MKSRLITDFYNLTREEKEKLRELLGEEYMLTRISKFRAAIIECASQLDTVTGKVNILQEITLEPQIYDSVFKNRREDVRLCFTTPELTIYINRGE